MFYVFEYHLQEVGVLRVLNNGVPFEYLEVAQMFCNEIIMENHRDMLDYIDFLIIEKNDNFQFKVV